MKLQDILVSSRQSLKIGKQKILEIGYILVGFLISRFVVFKFLNPFAVSYLSLFLGSGNFYLMSIAIATGFLSKLTGIYFIKYLVSIFLMALCNVFMAKKQKVIYKALVGCICLIISSLVIYIGQQNNFIITINLLESILIFCLVYLFRPIYIFMSSRHNNLQSDDLISFAIVFGSALAGMSDIFIGRISLLNIFMFFVLLILGNNYNGAYSSMFGLVLGMMLNLAGAIQINQVLILALAGIFSGAVKNNKVINVIILSLVLPVAILYLSPTSLTKEFIISYGISVVLFLICPTNFCEQRVNIGDEYVENIKKVLDSRLKSFASAFQKLSSTFNNISDKKKGLDRKDISKLIDNIASKTCENCSMKNFCWENNFYDTYQTVFSILNACEKKGYVKASDIPTSFRLNCVSLGKFVDNTNKLFEIYKINLAWSNRVEESRELVSQQLLAVSEIINKLADELDLKMNFDNELEQKVCEALDKRGIDFDSVTAVKTKDGKLELFINVKDVAAIDQRDCNKKMVPIINGVTDKSMCLEKKYSERGICKLKFVERQKYFVACGVSHCTKSDSSESGDCYSTMELKNNQFALVLSDGMGSGKRAKKESKATIELFENFMEAGFDKSIAIKMINSILVLKSTEESFSTLDICFVDLLSGNGEFIKTGASKSYLFRDKFLHVINSASLPIGILKDVDYEFSSKKFCDGDVIIMMTDGVLDTLQNINDKRQWILEILLELDSNNPQDIADCIMQRAREQSKGIIKDDMTILVGRIWEKI